MAMDLPPKMKFTTIDQYHSYFPPTVQNNMESLRKAIRQAAPNAQEVISYNMPAFRQNGVLVYYAAYRKHIGFYPTASPIQVFRNELTNYVTSRGAIQFPLDKPIPVTLVKKIVQFRVQEDAGRAAAKKKKPVAKKPPVKKKVAKKKKTAR